MSKYSTFTAEQKAKYRLSAKKHLKTEKGKSANRQATYKWRNKVQYKRPRTTSTQVYRQVILDFLIKRDGLVCGLCKKSLEASPIHFDHIVPVCQGGPNTMENLQLSHATCNLSYGPKLRK